MRKIYDNTLYYRMLRTSVIFVYTKFFRQIEVRGIENIPSGEPLIFAANHQNALMDALAIIGFQKDPIVFMARADMFKNKIAAKFLRSLKIAPIYRIRDGFENLTKNEKQMNAAVSVLLDRMQLCLMPEGNQGKQHKLRPLVKGLFRIAYTAEERLDGDAHVKIIPVGIDYNFYQHAGADLVVTYGRPIEVEDYIELYRENQANGLNIIRDRLTMSMSPLMHDIRSTSHYDMIYGLCCYGTPAYLEFLLDKGAETEATTMAGLRFDARFALGKILDKIDAENPEQILELDVLCKRLKQLPGSPAEVSEWMDDKQSKGYSGILMFLSIFLVPGFLINFPVWYISKIVRRNIEDTQMHSTFAFTIGILFNVITYLTVTSVICHFSDATVLQTLFTFFFVTAYGVVSERARQALRMPVRCLSYSFGARKEFVNQCKFDYLKLKDVLLNMLKNI